MNTIKKYWKKITTAFAALLAGLGVYVAHAQTVTDVVTVQYPTTRTDGAALPASEIAKATIAWGASAAGPFPNVQELTAPVVTYTFTRTGSGSGTRCYVSFVTDTEGRIGAQTPVPACKTVKAAPGAAGTSVQ